MLDVFDGGEERNRGNWLTLATPNLWLGAPLAQKPFTFSPLPPKTLI